MSDDLIAFVRARLDEEAREAEAASPGPWHVNAEADEVLAADGITVAEGFALSGQQLGATTAHIARHDPDRVLREVEAGRQAIEHYKRIVAHCGAGADYVLAAGAVEVQLKIRAAGYSDHPNYREEWKS